MVSVVKPIHGLGRPTNGTSRKEPELAAPAKRAAHKESRSTDPSSPQLKAAARGGGPLVDDLTALFALALRVPSVTVKLLDR